MAKPKWHRVEVPLTDEEVAAGIDREISRSNSSSRAVADGYLELSKRGWAQQQIAERFKATQSSVSRFLACARNYAVTHSRPPLWDAYREVDGHKDAAQLIVASDENVWYTPARYVRRRVR